MNIIYLIIFETILYAEQLQPALVLGLRNTEVTLLTHFINATNNANTHTGKVESTAEVEEDHKHSDRNKMSGSLGGKSLALTYGAKMKARKQVINPQQNLEHTLNL